MKDLPVDMKDPPMTGLDDVVRVSSLHVYCDGGGSSGHPGVWLRIGDGKEVVCGYCGRRFVWESLRQHVP